VLEALNGHKKFIRGEVAHRVNLKYTPEVRFREDESFDEALRIDRLLNKHRVHPDLPKFDEDDAEQAEAEAQSQADIEATDKDKGSAT
jgi:ribosome-binding factor A